MTRKDYIQLAKIVKDNTRIEQSQAMIYKVLNRSKFIDDLCNMLKLDNSLFNSDRFISACNDE